MSVAALTAIAAAQAGEATTVAMHHANGNGGLALDEASRALDITRAVGCRLVEQEALSTLSKVYRDLGDEERAQEFAARAVALGPLRYA